MSLRDEAEADAVAAIETLRDDCDLILFIRDRPWTQADLLAFIDEAKQRLNVVATAVPFL